MITYDIKKAVSFCIRRKNRGGCSILSFLILFLIAMPFFSTGLFIMPQQVEAGAVPRSLQNPGHVAQLRRNLRENYVGSLMMMTEQFTSIMIHQALIIGTFFDAKQQLETQRLFQELSALAHKNYQPSNQMCRFGTTVRSLATSEARSRANAQILNTMLMKRETLSRNKASTDGFATDINSRLQQFKTTYCDVNDNNGNLTGLCSQTSGPADRMNKDVNFMQTVGQEYTLDVNFTDGQNTASADEEDILALSSNLFSHRTFSAMTASEVAHPFGSDILDDSDNVKGRFFGWDDYQDIRSVIAMRGAVRNSYGHIVGMKSQGTGEALPFIKTLVEDLGVPAAEIDAFLGENPSYFAQMEVLTKKMYQDPAFFTNLYTKPANIQRTGVALQAIGLMQDRDRYDAALRREMLVSVLLEARLKEAQDQTNYNILKIISSLMIGPASP